MPIIHPYNTFFQPTLVSNDAFILFSHIESNHFGYHLFNANLISNKLWFLSTYRYTLWLYQTIFIVNIDLFCLVIYFWHFIQHFTRVDNSRKTMRHSWVAQGEGHAHRTLNANRWYRTLPDIRKICYQILYIIFELKFKRIHLKKKLEILLRQPYFLFD